MAQFIMLDSALPTITYIGNNTVGFSTGSHTHSGFSIGNPSPRRAVVAAVNYASSGSTVGITINGIAAANVVSQYTLQTSMTQISIALVPTGTSASVTIANTGFNYISACGVWTVTDLRSIFSTDTYTNIGTPASLPVAVDAHGVVVGVMAAQGGPTGVTWTVASRNFQTIYASGNVIFSGASLTSSTATTANVTASMSGSGSGTSISSMVASFR